MRIDKIEFLNFRKYVDTSIVFEKTENDLHLVVAENGAGKTTFLNAITWCLYNEEPKIKNKDEALPTLNTDVSNNSKNETETASVTITASDKNTKLIFKRSDVFKIHDKDSSYFLENNTREEFFYQEFTVTEIINGEAVILRDEDEIALTVESFIPEAIKEFFFFDGEQLDDYFLTSSKVKDQVFKLSHIFLLDQMERRIKEKEKDYRIKGSMNEQITNLSLSIDRKEESLDLDKKRFGDLSKAYTNLNNELNTLLKSIGNLPSMKEAREKLDKLNTNIVDSKKIIDSKNKKLMDKLVLDSPKLLAYNAFKETLDLIENNKDESYIYPIEEMVLEDSISEGSCKLCDRKLDDNLIEKLKNKKAKLYLISPEDKTLNEYNKNFRKSLINIDSYLNSIYDINSEISILDDNISLVEDDVTEIENTLKVNENQEKSINRRDELLKILPQKKSDLDSLNNHINNLEKEIDNLNKEYDVLCSKEEQYARKLSKKRLCDDSIKVINMVKEDIMLETRNVIENVTKDKFFNLIRKSNTYGKVEINDNYEVKLYDLDGRPAFYSASASEVELLALAFTLAIHSVSGYNAPLVVDTLLARTSGEQRLKVAEGCLDISSENQLLLFLLNEEYSETVQNLYKDKPITEYKLIESESEKEIIIEKV